MEDKGPLAVNPGDIVIITKKGSYCECLCKEIAARKNGCVGIPCIYIKEFQGGRFEVEFFRGSFYTGSGRCASIEGCRRPSTPEEIEMANFEILRSKA